MFKNGWGKFVGGFLVGSVGLSVLGSKIAQKGYRYVTAGAFIAKDSIMEKAEKIQGAASDIAADANEIKERYYESCEEKEMQGEETAAEFEGEDETEETAEEN
ncbi:MAG: DUF6110 family protein [Lachnospiraceae bacterium]|nr:DUF6110 family protein [Lachnospiraceae bacterium]